MKKTFTLAMLAGLAAAAPAQARDTVVATDVTQNRVARFSVYSAGEKIWTTSLPCKNVEEMGERRVAQMISAYASDAFAQIYTPVPAQAFSQDIHAEAPERAHTALKLCAK